MVIIFIPVPKRKPLKVPKAAFKAFGISEESFKSSPIKAPKNGAIITNIGPKNNDMNKPIVEPQIPALLPPDFFVNQGCSIVSKTITAIDKIPVTTKIHIFVCV